ncbi:MAG: RsiW-degrading membrane proteinase PrsW (M82 family) [Planctomycetota bacterium]|jgi:RsiW-degrading membrane proteinase PrsW (M82 family)
MQITLQTIGWAVVGGVAPTLLWLWFWLSHDDHPEPRGFLLLIFFTGALGVLLALPLEQISNNLTSGDLNVWINAGIEEVLKLGLVWLIALTSPLLDEPMDYIIYFITGALGFAALENTLFMINPIAISDIALTLTTSNLRFLGATLLHALASGVVGILLAISFHHSRFSHLWHGIIGILLAITLHALFNLFIVDGSSLGVMGTLSVLWVLFVVILLVIRRIKHMHVIIKRVT